MQQVEYPLSFSVDFPDRQLDRVSTALRILWAIPVVIVLAAVSGGEFLSFGDGAQRGSVASAGGFLFVAPLLMIVFRRKYPRWWFDWNLQLARFGNRVGTYLALMNDTYPSTDEEQAVHLEFAYPDAERDLNRWLPLVKWLLAIPHYVVLFFLYIAVVLVVIASWFAIVFTGRYPRDLFQFTEGVFRWTNRVGAYAFLLVTDQYPPFRLSP